MQETIAERVCPQLGEGQAVDSLHPTKNGLADCCVLSCTVIKEYIIRSGLSHTATINGIADPAGRLAIDKDRWRSDSQRPTVGWCRTRWAPMRRIGITNADCFLAVDQNIRTALDCIGRREVATVARTYVIKAGLCRHSSTLPSAIVAFSLYQTR